MNRYKYKVKKNICRNKVRGNKNMNMNILIEKSSVCESIEDGVKQIKDFKEDKIKFKSLKESQKDWDKWAKEVENEPR